MDENDQKKRDLSGSLFNIFKNFLIYVHNAQKTPEDSVQQEFHCRFFRSNGTLIVGKSCFIDSLFAYTHHPKGQYVFVEKQ